MSRDKIIEQALTHELRAADAPVTPACLDAETIAAWMDGGLDSAATAAAEDHVASCARCQMLVAGTIRTMPADVSVKAPSAFRIPGWFFPLGVAAAAGLIWMVVPRQQDVATAPAAPPAAVREAPATPPSSPALAQSEEPKKENAPVAGDTFTAERRDRLQAPKPARVQESDAKLKQDQDTVTARNEAVATPSSAASAAPAARAAAPMLQKAEERFAAPTEIASPDGSRRWRFADYGSNVTGGAAVSSTICWLIGRGGLVMLTTDGTSFTRVDVPEQVDLVSIAATDARTATVTTSDGRRLQTSDGGRSWR